MGSLLVLTSVISVAVCLKCRTSIDLGLRWTVDCSGLELTSPPPPLALHPVRALSLSDNDIVHLHDSQFINWTDIAYLDLSFNNIVDIDESAFEGLNSLSELNLTNNRIKVLSQNITKHLPGLRVLLFASNRLQTISPNTFEFVPRLLKLFIGNNPGLGQVSTNYKNLDSAFLQGLIGLNIANTSLTDLQDNFFDNATRLISLNIGCNPLTKIPTLPSSLRRVNVSGTLINVVSQQTFSKCDSLQTLSMENMPLLKALERNSLSELISLEDLYIRNCSNLSFISDEVFGESSPALKNVVISDCDIKTLGVRFQDVLSKARKVDLQGNPWLCDSRLVWMCNLPNLSAHLRCSEPSSARGVYLIDYYTPRSPHSVSSLLHAAILIMIAAILVASVVGMVRQLRKEKPKTYQQLQDITLQNLNSNSTPVPSF